MAESADRTVLLGICPVCRAPRQDPQQRLCPVHSLAFVSPEAAEHVLEYPLLGQFLDEKYAIVDTIGFGGFGAVYRALQTPLDRPVALKVMFHSTFAQPDARAKFEREARALAKLRSVHTVRLIDFGVTSRGPIQLRALPYLVMELLEGEGLDALLKRGPPPINVAVCLIHGVAESLYEAHSAGIVHRDLKPSNIIIVRGRDGTPVPKVIDFGIARVEGEIRTEGALIVGTPRYMAPEQVLLGAPLDGRVDVYALGVICFQLLTGSAPFSGEDHLQLLKQHRDAPVPSVTSAGLPERYKVFDPILRRAMAKNPDERYSRAIEFAAEFAIAARTVAQPESLLVEPSLLVGAGVTALPLHTEHPSQPTPARTRVRWILGSAAAVAFLFTGAVWLRPPTARAPDNGARPTAVPAAPLRESREAANARPFESFPHPEPSTASLPLSIPSAAPSRALSAAPSAALSRPPPYGAPRTKPAESHAIGPRSPLPAPRLRPSAQTSSSEPRAEVLVAGVRNALRNCRCGAAEELRARLAAGGHNAEASALTAEVARCRPIDIDHKCVDGLLAPRE